MKRRRINSFTQKPQFYQVTTVLYIIAECCIFPLIVFPNLTHVTTRLVGLLLFFTITAILAISWLICCLVDPTSRLVIRQQLRQSTEEDVDHCEYACTSCEAKVTETTKHCRMCNRCVEDFDHHCKWINNCIAKCNYRAFLIMIFSFALHQIVFLVFSMLLLTDRDFYNRTDQMSYITLGALSVISIFVALLDIQLSIFHCWLIKNKLTTYQFIKLKRAKAENRAKQIQSEGKLRNLFRMFWRKKSMNKVDVEGGRPPAAEALKTIEGKSSSQDFKGSEGDNESFYGKDKLTSFKSKSPNFDIVKETEFPGPMSVEVQPRPTA
eukprot:TRINITY_DN12391_c0_g1_i1.p1 TRINITY_DN12391_c0_g1~~TRINITY_DN12391_c0_g1_i1.p1  ORF type:complete len:323 (+),score=27.81 TRINITY_DN12391_c0_g1_i1:128-1096(+)